MYKEFAWAYSKKQAKVLMCRRIAKKQGVSSGLLFKQFVDGGDNFRIDVEIKMEDKNGEINLEESDG